jgi:hypothetical protein
VLAYDGKRSERLREERAVSGWEKLEWFVIGGGFALAVGMSTFTLLDLLSR